jgi:hypothetical protein
MTTLDLHGRFTLIHDISGIYIKVSRNYIKPGMEKMDDLTFLDEDEYKEEMASFKEWGDDAVKEITALATVVCLLATILKIASGLCTRANHTRAKANAEIERTVFGGMALLVRQQIGIDDQGDPEDSEDRDD